MEIRDGLELPPSSIIVGGPPCQGFSSAGLRRHNDRRNTLVGVFSRLIARMRPAAFVFENVEGFLTGANGAFVFELLGPLIEAGYRIHLRKVNAANFGVPQHRKRVVGIGGLGWTPTFPEPTHAAFGAPGAEIWNEQGMISTPTVREALSALPPARCCVDKDMDDHSFVPLKGKDLERARLLRPGGRMRDLPEELWHDSYRKRAFRRVMDGVPTERRGGAPSGIRRLDPDQPAKAITGGAPRDFFHPIEDRPLTIRECAVLQTFPVDFRFFGSQAEKMQMIGNAVPPLLARAIGSNLFRDLRTATPCEREGALVSFMPTESARGQPRAGGCHRQGHCQIRRAPNPSGWRFIVVLSKSQEAIWQKARSLGAGDQGVALSDGACAFLVATIARDLGLKKRFPEIPKHFPEFFADRPIAELILEDVNCRAILSDWSRSVSMSILISRAWPLSTRHGLSTRKS